MDSRLTPQNVRRTIIQIVGLFAITACVGYISLHFNLPQVLGNFGYIGAFILALIGSASIFFPAPFAIGIAVAGTQFDPFLLSIAAGTGSALGEMTGYVAGRRGHNLIPENWSKKTEEWLNGQYSFLAITGVASIPFIPFDCVGITAGVLEYSWWRFLLASILGKFLKYLLLGSAVHLLHWFVSFFPSICDMFQKLC